MNSRILDFGCGSWRACFGLRKLGFQDLVGMDISPAMAGEARKTSDWTIEFLVRDILDQEEVSIEPFDGILALHAITPIPGRANRIRAMKNLKELLRPSGVLIVETFLQENKEDNYWNVQKDLWDKWGQDGRFIDFGDMIFLQDGVETFVHIPNRDSFEGEIREAGLKISELRTGDPGKKSWYWILKP